MVHISSVKLIFFFFFFFLTSCLFNVRFHTFGLEMLNLSIDKRFAVSLAEIPCLVVRLFVRDEIRQAQQQQQQQQLLTK